MKRLTGFLLGLVMGCAPANNGLGEVHLCGVEDYNAESKTCRDGAPVSGVTARDLVCVMRVEKRSGATVRGNYFYQGELIHTFSTQVTTELGNLFFFLDRPGLSQVPGGAWRCEMTVDGETRSAGLDSAGPTDQILDAAVCPTTETLPETVEVCGADFSAQGMVVTNRITCSASLVGLAGHRVQTTLLHDGVGVQTSMGVEPDIPLSSYAKDFAAPAGFEFSPGEYACLFLVDGREVARRTVTLRQR